MHEKDNGSWYVEAQFGPLEGHAPPPFQTIGEAEDWVRRALAGAGQGVRRRAGG